MVSNTSQAALSTHAQSNGLAERIVKTMKGLLKHTTDPYSALLIATALHHCHGAITVLQSCFWVEESRQTFLRQPVI